MKVCRYCGTTDELTTEHLTPRARGGTNHHSNLGVSCRPCNQLKGPLTDAEYRAVMHDHRARKRLIRHQQGRILQALLAKEEVLARTGRAPMRKPPPLVQRIGPIEGWVDGGLEPVGPIEVVHTPGSPSWLRRLIARIRR